MNWEVWNLGVPGYNTAQELAYLQRGGRAYAPDLVVVGFFPNDFTGYEPTAAAARCRAERCSAAVRTMQRYVYSTEFYKRVYLTARWRLLTSTRPIGSGSSISRARTRCSGAPGRSAVSRSSAV